MQHHSAEAETWAERGHDIAIILLHQASQCWNRARHFCSREQGHETDHCQAAIVDFHVEPFGLRLITHFLAEAKWIIKVQRDWVWKLLKSWEISWLAAPRVVFF